MATTYTIMTDDAIRASKAIELFDALEPHLVDDGVLVALWFFLGEIIPTLGSAKDMAASYEWLDSDDPRVLCGHFEDMPIASRRLLSINLRLMLNNLAQRVALFVEG